MSTSRALPPRRGQARSAHPRRGPVRPPRLQHRVARRRRTRDRRALAHHRRRGCRGPAARAGHQAAEQARQRHQDRRARPVAGGAARAPAHQGARSTTRRARRSSRPSTCSGPGSSTSSTDALVIEVTGDSGKVAGVPAHPRALRHQGDRAVGPARHRPRQQEHHRTRLQAADPRRRTSRTTQQGETHT